MKPTRLVPLVLLFACEVEPLRAPGLQDDEALHRGRSPQEQIDVLREHTATLRAQLDEALGEISALRDEVSATRTLADTTAAEASLLSSEVFTVTEQGNVASRIEGILNTILPTDPATGQVMARAVGDCCPLMVPIKRIIYIRSASPLPSGSTGLMAEVDRLDADIRVKTAEGDAFDAGLGALCGASIKGSGLTPTQAAEKCQGLTNKVSSLEGSRTTTQQSLIDLSLADVAQAGALDDLTAEVTGLEAAAGDLDLRVCQLAVSTGDVLRGRWDTDDSDGTSPGFWSGLAVDTPTGTLSWEDWVSGAFPEAQVCQLGG